MYRPQDTTSLKPLQLVAVATSLLPEVQFTQFQIIDDLNTDFKSILLTDSKNQNYILQTANSEQVVGRFLAELHLTKLMSSYFQVPEIIAENGQIAIFKPYTGKAIHPSAYTTNQVKSLAKALANLHGLNQSIIQSNALPTFTNQQQQRIIMDTLDEAAMTGKIPAGLLERFEKFIESDTNWAYDSMVIHGDLRPSNVLFVEDEVNCITSWYMLRQSDPAYDLAGITPSLTVAHHKQFFDTYRKVRAKLAKHIQLDQNLEQRSEFYNQFELVTQLLISKAAGNTEEMDKVATELEELDEKLRLGDELAIVEQRAILKLQRQEEQERERKLQDNLVTAQVVRPQVTQEGNVNDTKPTSLIHKSGNILNSSPTLKQIVTDENASEIEQELKQMLTTEVADEADVV